MLEEKFHVIAMDTIEVFCTPRNRRRSSRLLPKFFDDIHYNRYKGKVGRWRPLLIDVTKNKVSRRPGSERGVAEGEAISISEGLVEAKVDSHR